MATRSEQRGAFETPVRVSLLEADADSFETVVADIKEGQRSIVKWLASMLGGLVVGSVLVALDLAMRL